MIYILKAHAKPSFFTLEFATYNEALAYAKKAADAGPSRPYKAFKGSAMPAWAVTVRKPQAEQSRAIYERFEALPGYLNWSQHIAPKPNGVTECNGRGNVEKPVIVQPIETQTRKRNDVNQGKNHSGFQARRTGHSGARTGTVRGYSGRQELAH